MVWESNQSVGNDNDSTTIQGRIVSSIGQISGSQFQVNASITGAQRDSAISALPSAGFVALWAGSSSGSDTDTSIQGRIFSNSGAPLASDFQVNTTTALTQDEPDVAIDDNGNLLAVWESPNGTTSRTQVFARFLNSSGSPVGSDFQIHTTNTLDSQLEPRVAAGSSKRFVITWYSDSGPGNDPDRSIQARVVSGEGQFVGSQLQINSGRQGNQAFPAVAGSVGRVVVVYHDADNPFGINDDGIVAAPVDLCLFCDGFEGGSTASWSSAVQ
ncbi:MAG: hypothetical protein DRJ50_12190 [Actinobacteria bacterium]|nr:MAG: hypothetical protein DRJ50_12190 [Actinomycetota bacterium]